MSEHRPVETWLTDMDGVLVHEEQAIPGAPEFVTALRASGKRFLVLTNNSIFTPRDLRARLLAGGIDVPEESLWTSALATAKFLADQRPGGSAFVVGGSSRRHLILAIAGTFVLFAYGLLGTIAGSRFGMVYVAIAALMPIVLRLAFGGRLTLGGRVPEPERPHGPREVI